MEQYFIEFTTVGKAEGNDGKGDDIVKFVFFVNLVPKSKGKTMERQNQAKVREWS